MDWWNFGFLLNENIPLYICILLGSLILYYFLYRKTFLSILDPIAFTLFFSAFGFSVVIFLYLTDSIELRYLISYLLTQFAFVAGFFSFKSLNISAIKFEFKAITIEGEKYFLRIVFFVSSSIYILVQLLSYKVVGIPLFLGTHVDVYNGASGWGLLGHIIDVVKPLSVTLLIYYLFNAPYSRLFNIYKYIFLCTILTFFALSDSRSEFMIIGLILFCYIILNGAESKKYFKNLRKYEVVILSIGICFVFFTLYFQSKEQDGASGLELFLFRLVSSGDVYYFAYPNKNIEFLDSSRPFLALFGDVFSTIRIIPRQNQPIVIGFQLFKLFGHSDAIVGPNARHNVFGYVYFGFYGSIIFSYLIGLLLSFFRNKAFYLLRKNVLGQVLFILVYLHLAVIETDPPMVITNLENLCLILPIIFIICFCCFVLTANFKGKNLAV
jgi:hypothetical protein